MKRFFKSWFFLFLVAFAVLFCVFMVLSGTGAQEVGIGRNVVNIILTPLQKGVNAVGDFFSDKFAYFTEFDDLKAEKERLEEENRALRAELREREKDKDENERLRAYLGVREENPDFTYTLCEIIARDNGNVFSSFTIDKGSMDGIAVKDAVINSDGLVGLVSEVGTNWAKVVTIINSESVIGALVSRTRDVAVLEGNMQLQNEGRCLLTMLPTEKSADVGDAVETSGLGGLYPKGLLIGTVVDIQPETHGMSYYATIEPAVDFHRVREVLVITDFGSGESDGSNP